MPAIEITAHDIETAIKQGLSQLQLLRAEVKIEVLEEGSRGVLGIGARQARVRLTPYAEVEAREAALRTPARPTTRSEPPLAPEDDVEALADEEGDEVYEDESEDSDEGYEDAEELEGDDTQDPALLTQDESQPDAAIRAEHELSEADAGLAAQLTQDVLDRMSFRTTCAGRLMEPADDKESASIWVAIEGEDAGRLLDHQSESLEALQLVVQNMWAHKTKSSIRITLDADQYKANREQRLRQMATRLAERAVSTGRSITLEPMPSAERRLVHLALRDHPQVFTESEGEGSQRRITIKLKK